MRTHLQSSLLIFLTFLVFLSCSSDSEDPTPEPDTTAPTVNFSIAGNSSNSGTLVVSNQIEINISALDAGGVAKVEAYIDDEKVGEDTTAPYQITIDVSGFASKQIQMSKSAEHELKIVVTDNSGNSTSVEQTIDIVNTSPLITINFPEQDINPELMEFYIFASSMDGDLLGIEQFQGQNSITITTTKDISQIDQYMLTFAEKFIAFNGEANELATIQNIKKSSLDVINLKLNPRFTSNGFENGYPKELSIEGLWDENTTDFILIQAEGFDYTAGGNACSCSPTTHENSILISRSKESNAAFMTNKTYFQLKNTTDFISQFALIGNEQFQSGFKITPDLFSNTGLSQENFDFLNLDLSLTDNPRLMVYAYENEHDFTNNVFHLIRPLTKTENNRITNSYWFDNNFENYRTEIIYNRYRINHLGRPRDTYQSLDWTLSHTFLDGSFIIDKSTSNQDFVGKIILSDFLSNNIGGEPTVLNGGEKTYRWSIVFDSQNNTQVQLPVLPEELKDWVFNNKFNNQTFGGAENFDQRQVELSKYEGLNSYDDYLLNVIKNNEKWYKPSQAKESVYDNPSFWRLNYLYSNHFLVD